MHRMARLRPRASAVPELMFSTSRCLTFFNTGAREKGPMSVLLTRPSRPEPHHNCRLCQRMEKTGLGLGVWSGQEAGAVRKQRLSAVYVLGYLSYSAPSWRSHTGKHRVLSTK